MGAFGAPRLLRMEGRRGAGSRRGNRRDAGEHALWICAGRPGCRSAGAPRGDAGHPGRGHQQGPALHRGADRPAGVRHRAAPLRRDGVRRSALADGRGRVAGGTAAAPGVPASRVSRDQRKHAGRPGGARRPPRVHPCHSSRRRYRALHARSAGEPHRSARLSVHRPAAALQGSGHRDPGIRAGPRAAAGTTARRSRAGR